MTPKVHSSRDPHVVFVARIAFNLPKVEILQVTLPDLDTWLLLKTACTIKEMLGKVHMPPHSALCQTFTQSERAEGHAMPTRKRLLLRSFMFLLFLAEKSGFRHRLAHPT